MNKGITYYFVFIILSFEEQDERITDHDQNFDAWGRRRNPETWAYEDVDKPPLLFRGYTGHSLPRNLFGEHYDEFNLINMNGRCYDPLLGRFLSPDNYVQMPDFTQNFNKYAYCLNNPLIYTDPSGEFIVPLIVAGLLLTDVGYDIQKAVSPVAVHVDLSFGSHSNGIGLDVSVGVPQLAPVSYRFEAGATYYFNRVGDYGSGWQTRVGGEWGLTGGLIRYGGLQYRDFDSDGNLVADQVVHTAKLGTPIVNVAYSNDTKGSFPWADHVPFVPKLRDGQIPGYDSDRYRTASGRLRVGLFEAGFFLHTGEGTRISVNADGTRHFDGGNINDADRSNGIIYVGFGPFKMGWDSEDNRNSLQNRLAHDHAKFDPQYGWIYPWVLPMWERDTRFVFQFGNF